MELDAVRNSYARWAPVYDATFGKITHAGRRAAVDHINVRGGDVLEVGVGTGLSLEAYDPGLRVTGVDYSPAMLRKARARVARLGLRQVAGLRRMDARKLDFPDASFDTVAAMHVLSVVPEPERVMAEIARVLRPGGQVVITNHFKHERGVWAGLARVAAPLERVLGWHSDFEIGTVLREDALDVVDQRGLPPMGMMTFLVLEKRAG
ncbi:class I SAM-dependent methyltransferase [Roseovarius autotrophicus]|uniref:class I SAM-dependent methyltransferase n=1 Tax=Roseovarius autotrophicus TaxID=2824121 RepID=UPI0019EBAA88|nr:methyltransferase domain-containing protein [Roseovarius autotrophicus]MBE0452799.1 methyltransferase domain-containing protein [Roseovarius sp.]